MAKSPSTPTVPRRRDAEANHATLLKAARMLMAESGPEAFTVSEVAHRAGVNRTTAYQHFRTREDLIGAVLVELSNETSLMLKAKLPPSQLIDHMTDYFLDHPEIARLWMFQMLLDIQLPSREGWNRYMKAMRNMAASEQAQAGIDPEMLGHILVAAILVWSLQARNGPEGAAGAKKATRRFTKELKRLLLFGAFKPEAWPDLYAAVSVPNASKRNTSKQNKPSKMKI